MQERSSSTSVSPKLERIAKLAKQPPNAALSTLAHHIDIDWLHEAYRRTRKDAAVGVDPRWPSRDGMDLGHELAGRERSSRPWGPSRGKGSESCPRAIGRDAGRWTSAVGRSAEALALAGGFSAPDRIVADHGLHVERTQAEPDFGMR